MLSIDNGSEFISRALDEWAYQPGVQPKFNRSGKPTDNAFVESFSGHFRDECLNQYWFRSLKGAHAIIEAWRRDDNTERPDWALGQGTPAAVATVWPRLVTREY